MDDIEKRARELLADITKEMYPDESTSRYVIDKLMSDELDLISARSAIRAIIAALSAAPQGVVDLGETGLLRNANCDGVRVIAKHWHQVGGVVLDFSSSVRLSEPKVEEKLHLTYNECVFAGPPPDGVESWHQALQGPVIKGLYIRAKTAADSVGGQAIPNHTWTPVESCHADEKGSAGGGS